MCPMRTMRTMRTILGTALFTAWTCAAATVCSAGEAPAPTVRIANAPPNTWIKLADEPTGFRNRPLFYYDPNVKKFVASGGEAAKDAHADTEQFDLASGIWTNTYPPGGPELPAHGPSPTIPGEWHRKDGSLKADKNGVMRIVRSVNPYEWDPGLYRQWAFDPNDGKCYAYLLGATLSFDARTSTWTDLKLPKFSKDHTSFFQYGTMAFDPVNREILSIGGTSDENGGTPGVWAFDPAAKEWRKAAAGSEALRELHGEIRSLSTQTAAVVNACRNRFYLTESPAESKRDLAAEAKGAVAVGDRLVAKLRSVKLAGSEANASKVALAALEPIAADLKSWSDKVGGTITGDMLVAGQSLLEALDAVERALSPEPCGRAASAAVTCAGKDKIVLFGGCRFDGYLADTWVYDCKARVWEQRFPKVSPAPRAGQVMAWLPKSKKVILYGATPFSNSYGVPHGNQPPPRDLWTYDVDANEWKLLAAAAKDSPAHAFGGVDADDRLIVVSRDPKNDRGRITWGMKVNPDAADAGSEKAGVAPGTVKSVFETPADFDKVADPDSAAIARFLKDIPANQWTLMPKPPKKINSHPWGSTPYDTLRHQFLSFGGGHSSAHFNDLAHYSLRTASWSTGYPEEFPYAHASFSAFFNQTFKNRPTVAHLWDGAAFDEPTGKAVFCMRNATWVYDPATRAWDYPPVWQNGGGTAINMKGTPQGAVYWDAQGTLQLYDVKARTWNKLPVTGAKLGAAYCDTGGIAYDSKRDCLWLGHGAAMTRYDMKTGAAETIPVPGKPEFVYMRATTYIPELDMILSAGRQPDADGGANLAYDIANKQWIALPLPCSDKLPRTSDKAYSTINLSLQYDPTLKLAILHDNQQAILVARFVRAGLTPAGAKLEVPKKR